MHSRTKVWFGSFALKWISWLSPNLGENRCATLNSCPQNGAMCALDLYVFVPLTSMAKSEQTDFTHFCVLKVCISSLSLSLSCASLSLLSLLPLSLTPSLPLSSPTTLSFTFHAQIALALFEGTSANGLCHVAACLAVFCFEFYYL